MDYPMNDPEQALIQRQLPDYPGPTVLLYAEQLRRFRNDYLLLLQFAADITGQPIEKMNMVDMEKARMRLGIPVRDALIRHWIEGRDL